MKICELFSLRMIITVSYTHLDVYKRQGVGDANVLGQDYSMRIWLRPDVMAQYKLVPSDVSTALAEQNVEADVYKRQVCM